MPIYYALAVGGERKGTGKVSQNEHGVQVDVNKMEVDGITWLVKEKLSVESLTHCPAHTLKVYYLSSRKVWIHFTGQETEGITQVYPDETVDTSSEHAVAEGSDGSGNIYLGVTAPPPVSAPPGHVAPPFEPDSVLEGVLTMHTPALAPCHYQTVACELRNRKNGAVSRVENLAVKLLQSFTKGTPPPFIFVGDSSGTGKTQLGMALRGIYLVMSISDQDIYNSFRHWSIPFQDALAYDYRELGLNGQIPATQKLLASSKKLWFLGLLVAAVKRYRQWIVGERVGGTDQPFPCAQPLINDGEFRVEPMTIPGALKALRDGVPKDISPDCLLEHYPCIILDEVGAGIDNEAALMRNGARLLGLPVVAMGTQARMINLTGSALGSRSDTRMWVHLLPRLDPPLPEAVERWRGHLSKLPPPLRKFFVHSMQRDRPLCSILMIQAVQAGLTTLPAIARTVGDKLRELKISSTSTNLPNEDDVLTKYAWLYSQLRLLMAGHFEFAKQNEARHGSCINSHFAHLAGCSELEPLINLEVNDGRLKCQGGTLDWTVQSVFAPAIKEPLLVLALLSTEPFLGFRREKAWVRVSVVRAMTMMGLSQTSADTTNSNAPALTGDTLEAVSAAAFVVASCAGLREEAVEGEATKGKFLGWIKGVADEFSTADDFETSPPLHGVRLSIERAGRSFFQGQCVDPANKQLLDGLNELFDFDVPLFFPPNQEVEPLLREVLGRRISELVRPKNSTEDDTILRSVEGMISSEQKNYSDRLSNKVFKECCDRIPTESWVHLLMTNESLMQGGYTAPRNRNIVVLRADVQGNILRLRYLTIDNKRKLATITQRKQKEDGKIEKGTTVIIVCECLSFSRDPAGFSLRGLRSTPMDTSA